MLWCFILQHRDPFKLAIVEMQSSVKILPINKKKYDAWATPLPLFVFQEIVLKKGNSPLGFSIVGGSDHASHPFGMDEPGIFISKVSTWKSLSRHRTVIYKELF